MLCIDGIILISLICDMVLAKFSSYDQIFGWIPRPFSFNDKLILCMLVLVTGTEKDCFISFQYSHKHKETID